MRFMLMFKPDQEPAPGEHACRQDLPEMARFIAELKRTGVVLSADGLLPSEHGARIKLSGGKLGVKDGPFAEAKELVAGVTVVSVASRGDAVTLARQFLAIAGGGECEIRQIAEPASH